MKKILSALLMVLIVPAFAGTFHCTWNFEDYTEPACPAVYLATTNSDTSAQSLKSVCLEVQLMQ